MEHKHTSSRRKAKVAILMLGLTATFASSKLTDNTGEEIVKGSWENKR